MGAKSFITVDGANISLEQAFQYLQGVGKLDATITAILREYVLEQELNNRTDLAIAPSEVNQIITDFRLQNQLTSVELFQQWLAANNLTEDAFRQQIQQDLQVNKLKLAIAQPRLQEHFIERKLGLDRVVLSRIVVAQQETADELKDQLSEGAPFEALARDYSITDDRIFNGMMGLISRGELPDMVRATLDTATPGDVIGPLNIEDTWMIFRVEALLPATLENPQVVQTLQNELLDQWIMNRLQTLNIEIQLDEA